MDLLSLPPMFFVVSGIVTITGINVTNRIAIGFMRTRWGVIAANYCVALALSALMAVANGLRPASLFTLALGFVMGFLYIGGMYLGMVTIGRRGA